MLTSNYYCSLVHKYFQHLTFELTQRHKEKFKLVKEISLTQIDWWVCLWVLKDGCPFLTQPDVFDWMDLNFISNVTFRYIAAGALCGGVNNNSHWYLPRFFYVQNYVKDCSFKIFSNPYIDSSGRHELLFLTRWTPERLSQLTKFTE